MSRIEVTTLEALLEACAQAGARAISLRVVDEIRPRTLDDGRVEVGPMRWVELSAYASGTIYALKLDGAGPDEVHARLVAAGLTVRRRSANVG